MEENVLLIEAMLFSAGRPLLVSEIAEATGLDRGVVRGAVRKLARAYAARSTAIEIVRTGEKYSMQLKREYARNAGAVAPTELPKDLISLMALIAYYQPVLQSELVRKRGARVYEEVNRLRELGLINVRQHGQTLELTTGNRFSEFFGIDARNSNEVKEYFRRLMEGRE